MHRYTITMLNIALIAALVGAIALGTGAAAVAGILFSAFVVLMALVLVAVLRDDVDVGRSEIGDYRPAPETDDRADSHAR